jgi:hypothetical protein
MTAIGLTPNPLVNRTRLRQAGYEQRGAPQRTQSRFRHTFALLHFGGHRKKNRTLFVLTAMNLVLSLLTVALQFRPAFGQSELPVLRGRGLEIVDAQGRVRASIQVLPPAKPQKGEEEAETVLLRLITERGRPSVKIASSEPASGLSFAGLRARRTLT